MCRNGNSFQYVCHIVAESLQVSFPNALDHCVDVRMFGRFVEHKIGIDKFGRHMKGRFGNQYMTRRRRRKRRQYFTDSLGKCRSFLNAVRNVGTKFHSTFFQIFVGETKVKELVHCDHARSGIGTSTRHTGGNRNPFIERNRHSFGNSKFFHKHFCAFVDKVVFVDGKKMEICGQTDVWRFCLF